MPIPWPRSGILQDFRPLRRFMRMDDPLWPVVREISRLILRREDIHVKLPVEFKEDMQNILLDISDYQPSKVLFPTFEVQSEDVVCIYERNQEDNLLQLIGYIGEDEPEEHVRWIKLPSQAGWNEVLVATSELHDAGYPGCIGCGGPQSELPWDEKKSRSGFQ